MTMVPWINKHVCNLNEVTLDHITHVTPARREFLREMMKEADLHRSELYVVAWRNPKDGSPMWEVLTTTELKEQFGLETIPEGMKSHFYKV